jgi:hypothetical protein
MECWAFISVALFTSAQRTEVFTSFWNNIWTKLLFIYFTIF